MNNPLKYTDPTGYTWWSHFTGWLKETVDRFGDYTRQHHFEDLMVSIGSLAIPGFCIIALTSTAASFIDVANHNWNWSKADPTNRGTIVNNSARITEGLTRGSNEQILSRFTWEIFQTAAGYGYSQAANTFGTVRNVNFYDGATVVQLYRGGNTAVTLGSFIIGDNEIAADPNNPLFQHEYGHYLQSQEMGPAFLNRVGLPSLFGKNGNGNDAANYNPVEQDANVRAIQYFHDKVGDSFVWDFKFSPIGYPGKGWSMSDYHTAQFQALCKSLTINSNFWDYSSWGTPQNAFFEGYINYLYYNKRFIDYQTVQISGAYSSGGRR